VEVDGDDRVTAGSEASFDVFVDFEGQPYPLADIWPAGRGVVGFTRSR